MRLPFSTVRALPTEVARTSRDAGRAMAQVHGAAQDVSNSAMAAKLLAAQATQEVKTTGEELRFSAAEVSHQAVRSLRSVEYAVWFLVGGLLVLTAVDVALGRRR